MARLSSRTRAALAAALSLAVLPQAARAAIQEEIATVAGPEGSTVPYVRGFEQTRPPKALAVLFTGGPGRVGLAERGIPRPGANFLVRTRGIFNRNGVGTAVIDVASDVREMSDEYRASKRHAEEVRAVVRDMKRHFGDLPVYLVGTSRGTVSAAYVGAALGTEIAGVVLSASLFNESRTGRGLASFDYGSLKSRLLFVHHVDDDCYVTPYHMAESVARGRTLVSVKGGDPPRSGPCDPFSPHGFFGVEGPTVRAMVRWIMGGEPPRTVP